MHIVLTTISILIVITGVAYRLRSNSLTANVIHNNTSKVLSADDNFNEEERKTEKNNNIAPTLVPTSTLVPTKPQEIQVTQSDSAIINYKYPGSQTVTFVSNSLHLTSTEDSDTITNWYKEKIRSEGLNVKSFVTTKTNDNVLNKLVGATNNKEIRVNIEKQSSDQNVSITVTIL